VQPIQAYPWLRINRRIPYGKVEACYLNGADWPRGRGGAGLFLLAVTGHQPATATLEASRNRIAYRGLPREPVGGGWRPLNEVPNAIPCHEVGADPDPGLPAPLCLREL
jgi:hypothetical protein